MSRKLKSINLRFKLKRFLKPTPRRIVSIVLFIFGIFIIPVLLTNIIIRNEYGKKIFEQGQYEDLSETRVAVVFGAGLNSTGERPGIILKDRLDAAVELYKLGKIQKIIVSGDNRFQDYNEPQAMYNYLIEADVKDFDLIVDRDGRSTYDTCYRLKEIFGVTDAILVTQRFHLPRSLYTCETLGIKVQGAAADKQLYERQLYNQFRETFALVGTFYKLFISPPEVVLGEKVVI